MSDYFPNFDELEAFINAKESLLPYYAQDYFDPMGFYPYDAHDYFDPMESFDHGATASFALPSEPSHLPQTDWALGANGYNPVYDTGNSLAGVDMAEMPYIPDIPGDHFYGTGPPVQHAFTQGTALLEPNNGSHVYPAFLNHSYTEFGHPTDLILTGQPYFSADMIGMGAERHADGNGFKRKDHLRQHLRAFHKFNAEELSELRRSRRGIYDAPKTCPHSGCFGYRDEHFHALEAAEQYKDRPFDGQKDFNEHMKKIHDETPFPCSISGCDRVGAKGYLRQKALVDHHKKKHPELEAYVPQPQSQGDAARIQCLFPGCARLFKRSYMSDHMISHTFP
ncbi:conserved hypothetical protein [Verticillium alfalfae VaMs.102]|uniref:C2H2-type domain-containing protein n=1 Tax=Verticillium alfalfae (strain VaMs.102 / ATCC MYA-4576 / FGSC 10136) TaxID=526221 RepID=C9SCY9_VERA1|nr:conserved hypothetical protein [Verticillium alfalfae VaMs.102]EEY16954.1 conserved hypothetical protein [Verticillium alfalfae VaMs.102]